MVARPQLIDHLSNLPADMQSGFTVKILTEHVDLNMFASLGFSASL